MSDEPAHMFQYWLEKYDRPEALEAYFPETLASSPELQAALAMYNNSTLLIDTIMERLSDEV